MPEEDKTETVKMLKSAYMQQSDLYNDLHSRIQQLQSMLKFRLKELTPLPVILDVDNDTEDEQLDDNDGNV
jgi:hypothetical protein